MTAADSKAIRWRQRFTNLQRAHAQLAKGLAIAQPSDIEQQGIIQSFEFTFELAWKTIKDYLVSQQVDVQFPRDVIKSAFQYDITADGALWLDMLEKRNQLAHVYDDAEAARAMDLIRNQYAAALEQIVTFFSGKLS